MEQKQSTGLPFGKRVRCGNFYVLKHTKALSAKEVKKLRNQEGVPKYVQKYLQRGTLPYITVGTVGGSWRVEFIIGMTMYAAIDEQEPMHDGSGNYSFEGTARNDLYNLFNFWFCSTSTVGDEEYQTDCINAMHRYLDRMGEKNKAPFPKEENGKVLQEEEERERHKVILVSMSNEIKEREKDGKGND